MAFGSLVSPKAGFLPVLAGSVAAILAVIILIAQSEDPEADQPEKINYAKLFFILMGMLFYVILLDVLGYFTVTFLLLTYLCKVADMTGWINPVIVGGGVTVALYIIFVGFLGVILP